LEELERQFGYKLGPNKDGRYIPIFDDFDQNGEFDDEDGVMVDKQGNEYYYDDLTQELVMTPKELVGIGEYKWDILSKVNNKFEEFLGKDGDNNNNNNWDWKKIFFKNSFDEDQDLYEIDSDGINIHSDGGLLTAAITTPTTTTTTDDETTTEYTDDTNEKDTENNQNYQKLPNNKDKFIDPKLYLSKLTEPTKIDFFDKIVQTTQKFEQFLNPQFSPKIDSKNLNNSKSPLQEFIFGHTMNNEQLLFTSMNLLHDILNDSDGDMSSALLHAQSRIRLVPHFEINEQSLKNTKHNSQNRRGKNSITIQSQLKNNPNKKSPNFYDSSPSLLSQFDTDTSSTTSTTDNSSDDNYRKTRLDQIASKKHHEKHSKIEQQTQHLYQTPFEKQVQKSKRLLSQIDTIVDELNDRLTRIPDSTGGSRILSTSKATVLRSNRFKNDPKSNINTQNKRHYLSPDTSTASDNELLDRFRDNQHDQVNFDELLNENNPYSPFEENNNDGKGMNKTQKFKTKLSTHEREKLKELEQNDQIASEIALFNFLNPPTLDSNSPRFSHIQDLLKKEEFIHSLLQHIQNYPTANVAAVADEFLQRYQWSSYSKQQGNNFSGVFSKPNLAITPNTFRDLYLTQIVPHYNLLTEIKDSLAAQELYSNGGVWAQNEGFMGTDKYHNFDNFGQNQGRQSTNLFGSYKYLKLKQMHQKFEKLNVLIKTAMKGSKIFPSYHLSFGNSIDETANNNEYSLYQPEFYLHYVCNGDMYLFKRKYPLHTLTAAQKLQYGIDDADIQPHRNAGGGTAHTRGMSAGNSHAVPGGEMDTSGQLNYSPGGFWTVDTEAMLCHVYEDLFTTFKTLLQHYKPDNVVGGAGDIITQRAVGNSGIFTHHGGLAGQGIADVDMIREHTLKRMQLCDYITIARDTVMKSEYARVLQRKSLNRLMKESSERREKNRKKYQEHFSAQNQRQRLENLDKECKENNLLSYSLQNTLNTINQTVLQTQNNISTSIKSAIPSYLLPQQSNPLNPSPLSPTTPLFSATPSPLAEERFEIENERQRVLMQVQNEREILKTREKLIAEYAKDMQDHISTISKVNIPVLVDPTMLTPLSEYDAILKQEEQFISKIQEQAIGSNLVQQNDVKKQPKKTTIATTILTTSNIELKAREMMDNLLNKDTYTPYIPQTLVIDLFDLGGKIHDDDDGDDDENPHHKTKKNPPTTAELTKRINTTRNFNKHPHLGSVLNSSSRLRQNINDFSDKHFNKYTKKWETRRSKGPDSRKYYTTSSNSALQQYHSIQERLDASQRLGQSTNKPFASHLQHYNSVNNETKWFFENFFPSLLSTHENQQKSRISKLQDAKEWKINPIEEASKTQLAIENFFKTLPTDTYFCNINPFQNGDIHTNELSMIARLDLQRDELVKQQLQAHGLNIDDQNATKALPQNVTVTNPDGTQTTIPIRHNGALGVYNGQVILPNAFPTELSLSTYISELYSDKLFTPEMEAMQKELRKQLNERDSEDNRAKVLASLSPQQQLLLNIDNNGNNGGENNHNTKQNLNFFSTETEQNEKNKSSLIQNDESSYLDINAIDLMVKDFIDSDSQTNLGQFLDFDTQHFNEVLLLDEIKKAQNVANNVTSLQSRHNRLSTKLKALKSNALFGSSLGLKTISADNLWGTGKEEEQQQQHKFQNELPYDINDLKLSLLKQLYLMRRMYVDGAFHSKQQFVHLKQSLVKKIKKYESLVNAESQLFRDDILSRYNIDIEQFHNTNDDNKPFHPLSQDWDNLHDESNINNVNIKNYLKNSQNDDKNRKNHLSKDIPDASRKDIERYESIVNDTMTVNAGREDFYYGNLFGLNNVNVLSQTQQWLENDQYHNNQSNLDQDDGSNVNREQIRKGEKFQPYVDSYGFLHTTFHDKFNLNTKGWYNSETDGDGIDGNDTALGKKNKARYQLFLNSLGITANLDSKTANSIELDKYQLEKNKKKQRYYELNYEQIQNNEKEEIIKSIQESGYTGDRHSIKNQQFFLSIENYKKHRSLDPDYIEDDDHVDNQTGIDSENQARQMLNDLDDPTKEYSMKELDDQAKKSSVTNITFGEKRVMIDKDGRVIRTTTKINPALQALIDYDPSRPIPVVFAEIPVVAEDEHMYAEVIAFADIDGVIYRAQYIDGYYTRLREATVGELEELSQRALDTIELSVPVGQYLNMHPSNDYNDPNIIFYREKILPKLRHIEDLKKQRDNGDFITSPYTWTKAGSDIAATWTGTSSDFFQTTQKDFYTVAVGHLEQATQLLYESRSETSSPGLQIIEAPYFYERFKARHAHCLFTDSDLFFHKIRQLGKQIYHSLITFKKIQRNNHPVYNNQWLKGRRTAQKDIGKRTVPTMQSFTKKIDYWTDIMKMMGLADKIDDMMKRQIAEQDFFIDAYDIDDDGSRLVYIPLPRFWILRQVPWYNFTMYDLPKFTDALDDLNTNQHIRDIHHRGQGFFLDSMQNFTRNQLKIPWLNRRERIWMARTSDRYDDYDLIKRNMGGTNPLKTRPHEVFAVQHPYVGLRPGLEFGRNLMKPVDDPYGLTTTFTNDKESLQIPVIVDNHPRYLSERNYRGTDVDSKPPSQVDYENPFIFSKPKVVARYLPPPPQDHFMDRLKRIQDARGEREYKVLQNYNYFDHVDRNSLQELLLNDFKLYSSVTDLHQIPFYGGERGLNPHAHPSSFTKNPWLREHYVHDPDLLDKWEADNNAVDFPRQATGAQGLGYGLRSKLLENLARPKTEAWFKLKPQRDQHVRDISSLGQIKSEITHIADSLVGNTKERRAMALKLGLNSQGVIDTGLLRQRQEMGEPDPSVSFFSKNTFDYITNSISDAFVGGMSGFMPDIGGKLSGSSYGPKLGQHGYEGHQPGNIVFSNDSSRPKVSSRLSGTSEVPITVNPFAASFTSLIRSFSSDSEEGKAKLDPNSESFVRINQKKKDYSRTYTYGYEDPKDHPNILADDGREPAQVYKYYQGYQEHNPISRFVDKLAMTYDNIRTWVVDPTLQRLPWAHEYDGNHLAQNIYDVDENFAHPMHPMRDFMPTMLGDLNQFGHPEARKYAMRHADPHPYEHDPKYEELKQRFFHEQQVKQLIHSAVYDDAYGTLANDVGKPYRAELDPRWRKYHDLELLDAFTKLGIPVYYRLFVITKPKDLDPRWSPIVQIRNDKDFAYNPWIIVSKNLHHRILHDEFGVNPDEIDKIMAADREKQLASVSLPELFAYTKDRLAQKDHEVHQPPHLPAPPQLYDDTGKPTTEAELIQQQKDKLGWFKTPFNLTTTKNVRKPYIPRRIYDPLHEKEHLKDNNIYGDAYPGDAHRAQERFNRRQSAGGVHPEHPGVRDGTQIRPHAPPMESWSDYRARLAANYVPPLNPPSINVDQPEDSRENRFDVLHSTQQRKYEYNPLVLEVIDPNNGVVKQVLENTILGSHRQYMNLDKDNPNAVDYYQRSTTNSIPNEDGVITSDDAYRVTTIKTPKDYLWETYGGNDQLTPHISNQNMKNVLNNYPELSSSEEVQKSRPHVGQDQQYDEYGDAIVRDELDNYLDTLEKTTPTSIHSKSTSRTTLKNMNDYDESEFETEITSDGKRTKIARLIVGESKLDHVKRTVTPGQLEDRLDTINGILSLDAPPKTSPDYVPALHDTPREWQLRKKRNKEYLQAILDDIDTILTHQVEDFEKTIQSDIDMHNKIQEDKMIRYKSDMEKYGEEHIGRAMMTSSRELDSYMEHLNKSLASFYTNDERVKGMKDGVDIFTPTDLPLSDDTAIIGVKKTGVQVELDKVKGKIPLPRDFLKNIKIPASDNLLDILNDPEKQKKALSNLNAKIYNSPQNNLTDTGTDTTTHTDIDTDEDIKKLYPNGKTPPSASENPVGSLLHTEQNALKNTVYDPTSDKKKVLQLDPKQKIEMDKNKILSEKIYYSRLDLIDIKIQQLQEDEEIDFPSRLYLSVLLGTQKQRIIQQYLKQREIYNTSHLIPYIDQNKYFDIHDFVSYNDAIYDTIHRRRMNIRAIQRALYDALGETSNPLKHHPQSSLESFKIPRSQTDIAAINMKSIYEQALDVDTAHIEDIFTKRLPYDEYIRKINQLDVTPSERALLYTRAGDTSETPIKDRVIILIDPDTGHELLNTSYDVNMRPKQAPISEKIKKEYEKRTIFQKIIQNVLNTPFKQHIYLSVMRDDLIRFSDPERSGVYKLSHVFHPPQHPKFDFTFNGMYNSEIFDDQFFKHKNISFDSTYTQDLAKEVMGLPYELGKIPMHQLPKQLRLRIDHHLKNFHHTFIKNVHAWHANPKIPRSTFPLNYYEFKRSGRLLNNANRQMTGEDFNMYYGNPYAGQTTQNEDFILLHEVPKSYIQKRRPAAFLRQEGPPMIPRAYAMLQTPYDITQHLLKPTVHTDELVLGLSNSQYSKAQMREYYNNFLKTNQLGLSYRKSILKKNATLLQTYSNVADPNQLVPAQSVFGHPVSPQQQYNERMSQSMDLNSRVMKNISQPTNKPIKFTF
jgi:hypothetical protein